MPSANGERIPERVGVLENRVDRCERDQSKILDKLDRITSIGWWLLGLAAMGVVAFFIDKFLHEVSG